MKFAESRTFEKQKPKVYHGDLALRLRLKKTSKPLATRISDQMKQPGFHSKKYLKMMGTLPETNIATEKLWLEDEMCFWDGLFLGAMLVSGRVPPFSFLVIRFVMENFMEFMCLSDSWRGKFGDKNPLVS